MKTIKLSLLLVISILIVATISAQITYTSVTRNTCDNGICNLEIYSGTEFVQEDGTWKNVKDARSLMNKEGISLDVVYGKEESDPKSLTIEDFNYTTIKLKDIDVANLNKGSKVLPIKKYDMEGNLLESKEEIISKDKINLTINWNYGEIIHLGENSTFLVLNKANKGILKDSYMQEENPSSNYGSNTYIRIKPYYSSSVARYDSILSFNLSLIPLGMNIIKANLSLRFSSEGIDSGEQMQIWVNTVNVSYNWAENTISWNSRPFGENITHSEGDRIFGSTVSTGYYNFSISDAVSYSYNLNSSSFTVYLNSTIVSGTFATDDDLIAFSSRENSLSGYNPIAYITYSALNETDMEAPNITIRYPTNNTYFNYDIYNVNFTATDASNISACWWSNDTGFVNTTLASCGNLTYAFSEARHNITIYANDTAGNIGSKIISFVIDKTIPNGTLLTPDNATITKQTSNNFTVNVTDTTRLGNVTLKIYDSLNNLVNSTINVVGDVVQTVVGVVVALTDGVYNWLYAVTDKANNVFITENNTITIDNTPPTISLISPGDGLQVNVSSQTFTASFTDAVGIKNVTFHIWNSTGELVNSTGVILTGLSNSTSVVFEIPAYGIYYWNYLSMDTLNSSSFASLNRTIEYVETFTPIGDIDGCVNVYETSSGLLRWQICRDGYLYTWSPSRTKYRCGVADSGVWTCSANG